MKFGLLTNLETDMEKFRENTDLVPSIENNEKIPSTEQIMSEVGFAPEQYKKSADTDSWFHEEYNDEYESDDGGKRYNTIPARAELVNMIDGRTPVKYEISKNIENGLQLLEGRMVEVHVRPHSYRRPDYSMTVFAKSPLEGMGVSIEKIAELKNKYKDQILNAHREHETKLKNIQDKINLEKEEQIKLEQIKLEKEAQIREQIKEEDKQKGIFRDYSITSRTGGSNQEHEWLVDSDGIEISPDTRKSNNSSGSYMTLTWKLTPEGTIGLRYSTGIARGPLEFDFSRPVTNITNKQKEMVQKLIDETIDRAGIGHGISGTFKKEIIDKTGLSSIQKNEEEKSQEKIEDDDMPALPASAEDIARLKEKFNKK